MFAFLPVVVVAVLAPLAFATLHITEPTAAGWVGNSTVRVAWTWGNDDPNFTIELGNPYIQSGLLAQGPIAVANNINPNVNSISFELPVLPPGNNYFVALVAVDNVSNVYANSSSFPIRDNPTSSTAPLSTLSTSPRPSGTSTSRTSTTRTNGTFTGTSTTSRTSTNTSTISTSQFTTLLISSLTPTTTATSSTRTGGAVRMEAAWYVGAVGAFLGAIFA